MDWKTSTVTGTKKKKVQKLDLININLGARIAQRMTVFMPLFKHLQTLKELGINNSMLKESSATLTLVTTTDF